MNDYLQRIRKEAVVDQSLCYPDASVNGHQKTTKILSQNNW
jgi:hypothetical protein